MNTDGMLTFDEMMQLATLITFVQMLVFSLMSGVIAPLASAVRPDDFALVSSCPAPR